MNPEMKTLYDERKMGENNNKRYSSSRTKETVPLSRTIDVNKDRDVGKIEVWGTRGVGN